MKTQIETVVEFHREWLAKNGTRILERERRYLLGDLDDESYSAFQQIPDSLDGLSTYFGIRGSIDLLDGKDSGWADISTAIDFSAWGLKIRAELLLRDEGSAVTNLTSYVSRAACLACVSDKWGYFAEKILHRIESDSKLVDREFWAARKFEPFVLRLCRVRDGETPAIPTIQYEPYDKIIAAWNNESALAQALDDACKYHCHNMDDIGGDWDSEFRHPPFDLIPCEVVFVRRIREKLGLPMPEVKHEIASLLKFEPSKIEGFQEHELVNCIQLTFQKVFETVNTK